MVGVLSNQFADISQDAMLFWWGKANVLLAWKHYYLCGDCERQPAIRWVKPCIKISMINVGNMPNSFHRACECFCVFQGLFWRAKVNLVLGSYKILVLP